MTAGHGWNEFGLFSDRLGRLGRFDQMAEVSQGDFDLALRTAPRESFLRRDQADAFAPAAAPHLTSGSVCFGSAFFVKEELSVFRAVETINFTLEVPGVVGVLPRCKKRGCFRVVEMIANDSFHIWFYVETEGVFRLDR